MLVVVSAALAGCDSISPRFVIGLSAEERALAAQIPVYPEALPPETFVPVGEVSGISCQVTHDERFRVSRDHAIQELRSATVRAGGNAVMDVRCGDLQHRTGSRRCFRSIECHGLAIQQKRGDNTQ